jgi:hypothetical protein
MNNGVLLIFFEDVVDRFAGFAAVQCLPQSVPHTARLP